VEHDDRRDVRDLQTFYQGYAMTMPHESGAIRFRMRDLGACFDAKGQSDDAVNTYHGPEHSNALCRLRRNAA